MVDIDSRSALIALNAAKALPREAVCRLSLLLDRWAEVDDRSRGGESSRQLGVPLRHVEDARRVLLRGGSTAQREIDGASKLGARILTLLDRDYPEPLRHLSLPPPVLYCRGRIPQRPAVAIVGSRQADPVGLEIASLFAERLARAGLAIVSGFARGVDTAGHRGALAAAGGSTVAVLGSGLDVLYPKANRGLAEQVALQGALVTEFPLGTPPLARNFPVRNRIIAALANGTLVVQATARSGSLITARLALELGRDVYAVPGPLFEERAIGTNTLIQDGALLVQRPRDILESLPVAVREQLPAPQGVATGPAPQEAGVAGSVLASLAPGKLLTADQVARRSGLTVEETLAALLELELAGRIRRCPGPAFLRRG